jgi:hypothetical protein
LDVVVDFGFADDGYGADGLFVFVFGGGCEDGGLFFDDWFFSGGVGFCWFGGLDWIYDYGWGFDLCGVGFGWIFGFAAVVVFDLLWFDDWGYSFADWSTEEHVIEAALGIAFLSACVES